MRKGNKSQNNVKVVEIEIVCLFSLLYSSLSHFFFSLWLSWYLDKGLEALLNASDSGKGGSDQVNYTSDASLHATPDSDDENSDTEIESDNVKTVQSKDGKIMWRLEPFPNKGKASSANLQSDTK